LYGVWQGNAGVFVIMSISFLFFLFFIFLFLAALFAFLETAFTALRLFKLKELQLSVLKYKGLFKSWETNPQRILITILIANNFAHVVTSVLISHIMQRFMGSLGLAVGVGVATIMILVFGEIIPKSFAKAHHERLFASCLGLINMLYHLVYPLVTVLLKIADLVFSNLGRTHLLERQDTVSEKEIEFLIDYSDQKGLMATEKTEMLQNVFSLGQTQVREIMIPKNDIVSISAIATIENARNLLVKSRFSRLPVYEHNEDNIIGMIHQKDIFELVDKDEKKPLKSTLRPILFIPESQKVNQLLSEFLTKRMHIGVVIDEYGNIIGLVTLEDILEEIVGDIADEHENIKPDIVSLNDGGWLVNGSIDLEELEETLKIAFVTEGSITLAGFLAEKLQHLPKKGERFLYEGYCFQIQQASVRRVYQVLVFEQDKENLLKNRNESKE
jgi:putative hemolysin